MPVLAEVIPPAADLIRKGPLIPSWTLIPIPNLSLSAGGILALADLTSVTERTAIKGGSSWLDAFVLVPGLHYQQAADALDRHSASALSAELGLTEAVEVTAGEPRSYVINNVAMVKFLKRLWAKNPDTGVMTLYVELVDDAAAASSSTAALAATAANRSTTSLKRKISSILLGKQPEKPPPVVGDDALDIDYLSHLLYLLSPLLTVGAIVLMVLLQEWWGLGFIIALMISRLLNIWVIKERSKPPIADVPPRRAAPSPNDRLRRRQTYKQAEAAAHQRDSKSRHSQDSLAPLRPLSPQSPTAAGAAAGGALGSPHAARPPPPSLQRDSSRLTEYTIDLSLNRRVILKGLDADLQAVTTQAWMRAKSTLEGYLEAFSKLIVYMIASLSGNLSQAGAIVLMVLLLVSSGLLGLSNAHSRSLQMHGRRVGRLRLDRVKFAPYDTASVIEEGQVPSPPDAFAVQVVPVTNS